MLLNAFVDWFLADWPIYTFVLLFLILIIVVVVCLIVLDKRRRNFNKSVLETRNTVRVFVIDFPNDNVTVFKVSSIRKVKTINISAFYALFPLAEQDKLISWVNALADGESNVEDFLETSIDDKKSKKRFFSILRVQHLDKEKKRIHLISYLMKCLPSPKASPGSLISMSSHDFCEALSISKKRSYSFCFRFCYRALGMKDKEIDHITLAKIKNALYPFVNSTHRFLLTLSGNELLFSDLSIPDKTRALFLYESLLYSINRFFLIESLENVIEVRVGAVGNHHLNFDGDEIISSVKLAASYSYEDNQKITFYEKDRNYNSPLGDQSYRTEVERIISDKKLDYGFRAIYSIEKENVLGYLLQINTKDTYFESLKELKEYALRTDDGRALFAMIAKNTVPHFIAQRPEQRSVLFYPVRIFERSYMLSTFASINRGQAASIAFVFERDDILSAIDPSHPDAIVTDLRTIKAKGYSLALSLGEEVVGLPVEVLKLFDYFVVSFSFAGPASEQDAAVRSHLHALVEKLLKFEKPIIASDIEGWPSIELIVRSGVNFISSESLSPYDKMILPLPLKSIRRVKDMKK